MLQRDALSFWETQLLRAADYITQVTNPCPICSAVGMVVQIDESLSDEIANSFPELEDMVWITCDPICGHDRYMVVSTLELFILSYNKSMFGERT